MDARVWLWPGWRWETELEFQETRVTARGGSSATRAVTHHLHAHDRWLRSRLISVRSACIAVCVHNCSQWTDTAGGRAAGRQGDRAVRAPCPTCRSAARRPRRMTNAVPVLHSQVDRSDACDVLYQVTAAGGCDVLPAFRVAVARSRIRRPRGDECRGSASLRWYSMRAT